MTLRQARWFVLKHHRTHKAPPQGGLFAVGILDDLIPPEELVGVAICGRPVSAVLQRRGYLEVTRVCVLPGVRNGCSMLYGRCRRIAQVMGYARVVTYTLSWEPGTSLVAAGFEHTGNVRGRSWSSPSRPRHDQHPLQNKFRWESAA